MARTFLGEPGGSSGSKPANQHPGRVLARVKWLFPRSIRGILILLLLVALVPREVGELGFYFNRFQEQREQEYQANLELARSVGATFDAYVQDILRDEASVGLAFVSKPPLSSAYLHQLLTSTRANPAIRNLGWVDSQGEVQVSSGEELVGMQVGDSPYFQEIVQGQEWAIGDLAKGRASDTPTFTVARGFRDSQGNLQGVVVAALDPQRLDEVIKVERSGGAAVVIIDKQGWGVYRYPEMDFAWEQRNWMADNPIIGRALAGEESTGPIKTDNDPEARLASFTPIRSIGWVAAASRPEAEVMAPLMNELFKEIWEGLIIATLAFLLALLAGNILVQPLRRLRDHAVAFGRGDLGHRVEVTRPAELAELANSFNQMSQAVETRTKERELMLDAVRAVANADGLDAALDEMARLLAKAVNVPVCRIALLTNDDRDLVVAASFSSIRQGPSAFLGHVFPLDQIYPASRVIEARQIVEIPDPDSEILPPEEKERWRHLGIKASMGAPLVARDKVIGILNLADVKPRVFTQEEKSLCLAIAQQASIAIEKARLYEQMATEREHLDAIFQNTSDGIVLLDADRTVTQMNPAMESLCGWTAREVKGRHCWEVFQSRDHDGNSMCDSSCPILGAAGPNANVPYTETVIVTKDGRERDLSVSYAWVRLHDRDAGYWVVVARDITKVKEVERLKDEFVSLLSHDLRNPLSIAQGHAQLILSAYQKAGEDSPQRRSAEAIVTSARRMNVMIQDLVDSTRLESGQIQLERQPLDLQSLLSSLLERASVRMEVERIRVEIPEDLPSVLADPDRLERILLNLLSNALKYSPQTTEVCLKAEKLANEVLVSVRDSGVGIDAEDLPHMFERFYRAKKVGAKYEGLGLGLYITRMLVEAHQGRIWVESELGKGSVFHFTLLAAHHEPPAEPGAGAAEGEAVLDSSRTG